MWDLLTGCGRQLRVAPMGGIIGVDMGVILSAGAALDIDVEMLADVLPSVEAAILTGMDDGFPQDD